MNEVGINQLVKIGENEKGKALDFSPKSQEKFKGHFRIRSVSPLRSHTPFVQGQVRLKKNAEILIRPNTVQNLKTTKAETENKIRIKRSRQLTQFSSKKSENDYFIKPEKDSFDTRYQPQKHLFYHKLIGEIRLPIKNFKLSSQKAKAEDLPVTKSNYFQNPSLHSHPHQIATVLIPNIQIGSFLIKSLTRPTLYRKILSASKHYKDLQLFKISFKRFKEFIPGRPFAFKNSKKFIKACKDGEILTVNYLLQSNKWLAHAYDYSGLTALHWAVIRNKVDVVKSLIAHKAFVDVNDSVWVT